MKKLIVKILVNNDRLSFIAKGNREDLLILQETHATRNLFRRYYNRQADVEIADNQVWVNNKNIGRYYIEEA